MSKKVLLLALILALAIVLRVFDLHKVPPALFGDEIDVGYQAYSLLRTGKDFSGRPMPLYIRSLAEYRAPLYIYSAVPFVEIFGLNEWGVRLPAVFWGVVSIFGLFLLSKKLFNHRTALVVAGLTTISPWHLQYSRASFEVTMLLSFLIFAAYFFLRGLKQPYFLGLSSLFFGASVYIYSTAIVFTPLFLALLIIIFWRQLKNSKKSIIMASAVLFLVILPAAWSIYNGEARERFSLVGIFQDSVLLDKINIARRGEEYFTPSGEVRETGPTVEAFFHNKPTVFAQVFVLNYLRAFSPEFLFAQGDPNFRHAVHEMGLLYYFELILILLGMWALLTKENLMQRKFILGWLILAPVPAALTYNGGFHATRLFIMIPPLLILASLGIYQVLAFRQSSYGKVLISLLLILIFSNTVFYLHRYYVHYPVESWRFWHVGFKEALSFVRDNQSKYRYIVINNSYEPSLERYLFYTQYDPARFQREYRGDSLKKDILPGIDGFALNNQIYFGVLNDGAGKGNFDKVVQSNMLYLASARDETDGNLMPGEKFSIVKKVVDPWNNPIFYLLEGK